MTSSRPPIDQAARDALAGGYVLGTLEPWERAAVDARLLADSALAEAVREWERRLAPLADLAEPVSPPPDLWRRIAGSAGIVGKPAAPEQTVIAPRPRPAAVPVAQASSTPAPRATEAEPVDLRAARERRLARLERSARGWRFAAGGCATALAASLAIIGWFGPTYLEMTRDPGRYVGIVNTGGEMPALVVSIDTRRGELKVRPLGIKAEAGKSHELWAVRGNSPPVSLGLVDAASAREVKGVPKEALADPALVLAVSVEPAGGSPTGRPTGPVVLTGKLFREE